MMLDGLIEKRRSIRRYTSEPVEFEKIVKIVNSGIWAPSACNKQEIRFIYIDNNKDIMKIYELGSAHFLKNCNQAILVLYDNRIDNIEYMDNIQSASASIENMMLKATELNVGTCWVCNLPAKNKIRKLFKIPSKYDPIALMTIGNYDYEPKIVKRKHDVKDIRFINEFDKSKDVIVEKSKTKLFVRKLARKIYLKLPKTKLLKKIVDVFEKKFDN